ncbi:MAG: RNA chaperone Hfq [Clostridia bacterium]|nr:RNA chaperone Hfq [Clostridia bacterium]
MKTALNLQDTFLNQARKERVPLTVYLMNGVKMFGTVKGFDSFLIVLESNGVQNVIYKHAVSTVIPSRSINLLGGELQQSEEVQEAKEAV